MLFRKIVSALPFSSALVGQLGFYANRLRKEETTRRAGLVFVALALIVQSFAVFSPPESANAASANNIIYGGVKTKSDLLQVYDTNRDSAGHRDIQQIYSHFGITRADIANAREASFNSKDYGGKILNIGRGNQTGQSSPVRVNGSSTTVYQGYIRAFDTYQWSRENGSTYKAVIGKRAVDGQWFAIMFACGNPMFLTPPPAPKPPTAACTSLQAVKLSRTGFRFDARATVANGAKISSYTFVIKDRAGKTIVTKPVASTADSATTSHTLPADGTYSANVTVQTSVGNKSGTACNASFVVSPAPPQPTAECTGLKITPLSRTNFRFTGTAAAKNGATLSSYSFVVKDKSGAIITTKAVASTAATATATHNFAKDGTYTITLTVTSSVGQKSGAACIKNLTITPEERCPTNPDYPVSSPECKPCKDDPTIWYKDENCKSDFELTKTVRNTTQLLNDANNTTAKPGDQLEYRLTVKNVGHLSGQFTITDNLSDVLEYADVVDAGGGTIATAGNGAPIEKAGEVTWPSTDIAPGQSVTKIVLVQIKSTIPATPQSPGNLASYDCQLANNFQDRSTTVLVNCPITKIVERVVTELPQTGAGENMIFAGVVLAVVTFFYARARQLKKEVRLVRRDLNTGTI